MQRSFDFGVDVDVLQMRDQLVGHFGEYSQAPKRTPIAQLVKSLISSRTHDEVSLLAFIQLTNRYASWSALADAPVEDVQRIISEVTFPDIKAQRVHLSLGAIRDSNPKFDLQFLSRKSTPDAIDWLEQLPGVGRKVSAAVLNFSTLRFPALVIDTHVLRVLRRYGIVRPKADTLMAYETMMEATSGWSASELTELHDLLKRLGKTHCRHHVVQCQSCSLRYDCVTAACKSNS
ncbi:MAG: endonuclease [Pseudomonadota bacterium]